MGATIERWLEAERDQLGLWLPVGLGAGITAWFGLPDERSWLWFVGVAAATALLAWAVGRGGRLGRAIAIFLIAASLGCLLAWARSTEVASPRLDRPMVTTISGRIVEVDPLPARGKVRLVVDPDAMPGLPPRVRINVDQDGTPNGLAPGARIAARVRLEPPAGPILPGAYDFARVAWFQRLGATGKTLGPVTVTAPARAEGGPMRWLDRQRLRLTDHIQQQLRGSTGGVAAAFVTGDVGAIADEDNEAFRRSGLAHLLSISGLHVTAVIAATMLLTLRSLALWPWLALRAPLPLIAAAAGAAAGIGYTLLSGAQVPTVRSCVAALLVLGGIALGREALTLRLVATGALVVLLIRPEALVGPSFQLSFAAVTAIVAFHEHPAIRAAALKREESWPRRLLREFVVLLVTGLLVEAALAPIAAWHFHRAGFYGALANIVAIPLSTFVIMPAEAAALLFDMIGLGSPFWWLAGQALHLLLWIARTVAALPGAVAALPGMPNGAFALMAAGGLWLALWRTHVRRLGALPIILGAAWAIATPAPDLLVTGDGRHLAVRTPDGALHLLRPRAGDYVRGQLSEASGVQAEALDLDALPGARCNDDMCAAIVPGGGRRWHLLASRSAYAVDWVALTRACGWADIVVSDRRLPRACTPRWLKLDRAALARTGGVALWLRSGTLRAVRGDDRHPWQPPSHLRHTRQPLHADATGGSIAAASFRASRPKIETR
ncbi:ComEC/Rec2 family competence protein [Sphingomonas nostoxanthinifaciens]|uniref:ComEC/Rec2 family competence protein n=1 Tax=Sphingomonas nostoxanthinifaciens TaxID=2872652 RepID=UPI001CC1C871|nr:ComEC/Rec2 family competence protein [Sphingomonas nostoxanthinifaciens]